MLYKKIKTSNMYITNSDLVFKTHGVINADYVDSSGNLNITAV